MEKRQGSTRDWIPMRIDLSSFFLNYSIVQNLKRYINVEI